MAHLILHHFVDSPFAEKVRRMLAAKRLDWLAVEVPMVAPKPDLVALTGGYRRTPVLQIGADILCDTALIARVLDGMQPEPRLHGDPPLIAGALVAWAEHDLFDAAMAWCFQPAGLAAQFAGWSQADRDALIEDRRRLREGGAVRRLNAADAAASLAIGLSRLSSQLSDGRPFLLGARPGIADFATWPALWAIARLAPVAGVLDPWSRVRDWMGRMQAFGPGLPRAVLPAAQALAMARAQEADPARIVAWSTAASMPAPAAVAPPIALGERLRVMPNDYGFDPVEGEVVASGDDHVALQRDDARGGRVVVHFPRIGYTCRVIRPGR